MAEVKDPALIALLEQPQTAINTAEAGGKPKRPLPEAAMTKLEEQVSALSAFERSGNLFKDDFSGFGSGVENVVQGVTGLGTEGQRDWWADFNLNDARLRNAMFGASLTGNEQAAWQGITVSPSMRPEEVKRNINRRRELAREILSRRARAYKAGPYDQEMVGAVLGEYDPDLPKVPAAPHDPTGEGDIGFENRREVLGLPPGAEGFPREAEAAVRSGKLRTAGQLMKFAKDRGFDMNMSDARAAAAHIAKGGMPNFLTPQFLKVDISDARGEGGTGEAVDATVRGVADTVTMGLASEGAAALDELTGGNPMRYNMARQNAIDEYDVEHHFAPRLAGQVAGGLVLPSGITGSARAAGMSAFRTALRSGAPRDVAKAMAVRAARQAGAVRSGKEGTAYGAAYGAGSGDGSVLDRLDDAAAGALAGFTAGRAVPAVGSALGAVSGRARNEFGAIAERLGVNPAPSTTGGDMTSALQTTLSAAPGASVAVQAGLDREVAGLAAAARKTASDMGPVVGREQAGNAIVRGAGAYGRRGAAQGRKLYEERDRLFGGSDSPVPMASTNAAFREFADQYPTSPMLEALRIHPAVRKLEGGMEGAPSLTLSEASDALSFARSQLRNLRSQKKISRQEEAQVAKLEQAIEDDVMLAAQRADLAAGRTSGPGSAQEAQRVADAHWRELRRTTDGAMKTATRAGREEFDISGSRVYNELLGTVTQGKTNLRQFDQIWNNLPRGSRRTFSATAFDDLGKAKAGQQDAAGAAWSWDTFLTNWSNIDASVKRRVFGDSQQVDDIVRYSARLRQLKREKNPPNTARNALAGAWGLAVAGSVMAGEGTTAAVTAAGLPVMAGVGEAFMRSPQTRKWLATALRTAAKGTPGRKQLLALTNRLPKLAATDPAIEEELLGLREKLLETLGTNAPEASLSVTGKPLK